MKKFKPILISALVGGVVGAVAMRFGHHGRPLTPTSLFDKSVADRWQFMAAALAWVVFSLYWEVAAKNAAEAKSKESQGSRKVHVFLVNWALLLEIVPLKVGRFLPLSSPVMTAGVLVELMGLALAILARRYLGRNWSGEISIKVDHRLIRSGPYRRLRHPIYTGLLTMYAGTAAVSGTWLAIVGLGMAVFAYWRKLRLEEANLRTAFGAEYEAYRQQSWALVPGLF